MSGPWPSLARAVAAGAAGAALALAGTSCTADGAPGPSEPAPSQVSTPSPGTAASDGGGQSEAPSSPFTQDELDAAAQRFVQALQVLDDGDWDAACAMVLDPTTQLPPEGERLSDCADGVGATLEDVEGLTPGAFDALDPAMVEVEDTGDDLVRLSVLGEQVDIAMTPGADGAWYLAIPF